ncbi:MAG TPA: hypothetical protein VJM69_00700 [Dehalococcoidia bacterium]|nr:hypothetical protein [Dehalococcoidia bacterium]
MDIAQMRARVRRDLHDEDAASYRWTDAELDRHIQRAVAELSLAAPLETRASLTTSGGRELDIGGLSGQVAIEAVEYPAGSYPASLAPFSLWGDTLTLLVDQEPPSGETVYVYYGKLHTLDAAGSTLPVALQEVVAAGAAAYAALEWASFAANRVNVGGEEVWRRYLALGQERLAAFAEALARLSRRLKLRRLHRPGEP